jgi:hypothetical protein
MNDIEVQVIDKVIRAVKAEYPKAKVEDRFTENPASFPYVCVYETNSFMPQRYQDNTRKELYTEVAYEAQFFTNDTMKKSTAKAIAEIVDTTMQDIGFLRTFKSQVPNIDRTIYRIVLRYTAVVENATYGDTNNVINIYHR